MNIVLLDILHKYLGSYTKKKDDNYAFYCPFCNHVKQKLEIDIGQSSVNFGKWNCWVCHTRGKSLHSLLSRLQITSEDLQLLSTQIGYKGTSKPAVPNYFNSNQPSTLVTLPEHYKSLDFSSTDLDERFIINKLKGRGLSEDDIRRYKIGFIKNGLNKGMAVIPSYDDSGKLNYYILRDFKNKKYINPPVSKDIIVFDLFINWNEDIILVEGVFDAFAIQSNAIPLLGKILNNTLKRKIATSNCKNFYICLDGGEKPAMLEIAEYVIRVGKNAHIVTLPSGEDPSSIGKTNIKKFLEKSTNIDLNTMFMNTLLNKFN